MMRYCAHLLAVIFLFFNVSIQAWSQKKIHLNEFLKKQIAFIHQELEVNLDGLNSPENTPDSLFGVSIKGDFAFAHMMVALELDRQLYAGSTSKYDTQKWIEGLLAQDANGTTFAQLFAMQTRYIQLHGPKPKTEALSQTSEKIFASMSDIRKFYSPESETVANNRPPNYLAVALLTGSLAYANGYEQDKDMLLRLLQKCIAQLRSSGNYLSDDNNNENARYDRYGMEFSLFLYEAAKLLDAKSELTELKPFVEFSGKLWWNLLHPETGCAFQYGRSLQNTWDDSMEQAAFFIENPEVAPAPAEQLAAIAIQVWKHYLKVQYNEKNHLNRMLDEGRGTYSYAGRNRIWGYTIGTFSKALKCFSTLQKETANGRLNFIQKLPEQKQQSTFTSYRTFGKPAGVWIVKTPNNRIMVPFTDGLGSKPISDYLSGIYGLEGFAWPVSLNEGFLVPEIQTTGGQKFILNGRPDSLIHIKNETEIKAVWKQMVSENGKEFLPCSISGTWTWKKGILSATFIVEQYSLEIESLKLQAWATNNITIKQGNQISSAGQTIKFSSPLMPEDVTENEKGAFATLNKKVVSISKPEANSKKLTIGFQVKIQ